MTFWFRAREKRTVTCDFLVSGPGKTDRDLRDFWAGASIPREVGPQSQAPPKSHASHGPFSRPSPQKSQVTALSPGPGPPKVTSHGLFSRPQNPKVTPQFPAQAPKTQKSRLNPQAPQKSRKSRPFLLAQAPQKSQVTALSPDPGPPKVTQATALSPGPGPPKVTSHGPFSRPRPPKSHKSRPFLPAQAPQKSQVTALSPGPKTQKSRLNSRPRPPKPKSHASIPGRSGLNPRPPKSHASHGPFSWPRPPKSHFSRPRPPKGHKSRPFLLAQAPQKSQVTARFPAPKPTSHKSRPSRPAPKPKSHASIPTPKVTSHGPFSRPQRPRSHGSTLPVPAGSSLPAHPNPLSPAFSLHSERLARINEDVEEGHNERLATREGPGGPGEGWGRRAL